MSKYVKWYDTLISYAKQQNRVKSVDLYFEEHHIMKTIILFQDV